MLTLHLSIRIELIAILVLQYFNMVKRIVRPSTEDSSQQVKKGKGRVSSVVEGVVVNDTERQVSGLESVVVHNTEPTEPNDVVVVVEDVDGVGAKTTNSHSVIVPNEKISKVQDLLSVFLREKESEASCKKQVALAGRERDAASQMLRKSQTDHSIAVAKHDKLQGELRLKSITVELVRSAWESAKADAGVKDIVDNELKVSASVVSPERKK